MAGDTARTNRDWGIAARATAIGLVIVALVLIGWALQGVLSKRHPEERAWLSPNRMLVTTDHGPYSPATATLWTVCDEITHRVAARFEPSRDPGDGAPNQEVLALDNARALIVTAGHPRVWSVLHVSTGRITPTTLPLGTGAWTVVRGQLPGTCRRV